MDAGLMRRFVRYHKLVVTFGNDELDLGVRMIANELHGSATDENVIAVVQALTRIEAAETLLNWHVTSLSHGTVLMSVRSAYEKAAAYLFTQAQIDHTKWRKVTT
jgi:hypothetical protein